MAQLWKDSSSLEGETMDWFGRSVMLDIRQFSFKWSSSSSPLKKIQKNEKGTCFENSYAQSQAKFEIVCLSVFYLKLDFSSKETEWDGQYC